MSTTTIRSLRALHALAHIELGEGALMLADQLDAQAQAAAALRRCETQAKQLGAVYERLAKPGAPIYTATLDVLARQSVAGQVVLDEAQSEMSRIDQEVDAQRQVVQQHQTKYESLGKFLKEARKQHAAEIEKVAGQEREDLFLVRLHLLKEHA